MHSSKIRRHYVFDEYSWQNYESVFCIRVNSFCEHLTIVSHTQEVSRPHCSSTYGCQTHCSRCEHDIFY